MLKRVITYGSYDMLHYGHRRLLERAKALGDYLIVGVTSDDYDKVRGKVNLQQNLYERISAVEALGIADQIIVEEYDGQKIDDIQRYNIDIFAIGSDWTGKFDYLKEYCQVVYLERTPGISSTEIRSKQRHIRLGLIGDTNVVEKYWDETQKVNGVEVSSVYTDNPRMQQRAREEHISISDTIDGLLDQSDAIYLRTFPEKHFDIINNALIHGKHVLCECPVVHRVEQWEKLNQLALQHKLVLWGGLKTAYSTAFNRLILLVKTGIIGQVTAIDATASSLSVARHADCPFFAPRFSSGNYSWREGA